jgi:hypothetical protein
MPAPTRTPTARTGDRRSQAFREGTREVEHPWCRALYGDLATALATALVARDGCRTRRRPLIRSDCGCRRLDWRRWPTRMQRIRGVGRRSGGARGGARDIRRRCRSWTSVRNGWQCGRACRCRPHDVSILTMAADVVGRWQGVWPRSKVSMTCIAAPQQGHFGV